MSAVVDIVDGDFVMAARLFLSTSESKYKHFDFHKRAYASAVTCLEELVQNEGWGGDETYRTKAVRAIGHVLFVGNAWERGVWGDTIILPPPSPSLGSATMTQAAALTTGFARLARSRDALELACDEAGGAAVLGVDSAVALLTELDSTSVVNVNIAKTKEDLRNAAERATRARGCPCPPLETAACIAITTGKDTDMMAILYVTLDVKGGVALVIRAARLILFSGLAVTIPICEQIPAAGGPRTLPATILACRLPPLFAREFINGDEIKNILLATIPASK